MSNQQQVVSPESQDRHAALNEVVVLCRMLEEALPELLADRIKLATITASVSGHDTEQERTESEAYIRMTRTALDAQARELLDEYQKLCAMLPRHLHGALKRCRHVGSRFSEISSATTDMDAIIGELRQIQEEAVRAIDGVIEQADEQDAPVAPPIAQTKGLALDDNAKGAYWNGKLLKINPGDDYTFLKTLKYSEGWSASYDTLKKALRPTITNEEVRHRIADPELKEAAGHIRKAFRAAKCPYQIIARKGTGYQMTADQ